MDDPSQERSGADRRLWEFAFVRDLACLAVALLGLGVVYLVRWLLAPIVVGFVLAYIVEPLVALGGKKFHLRRGLIVALLVLVVVSAASAAALWLGPQFMEELRRFDERHTAYLVQTVQSQIQSGGAVEESAELVKGGDPQKLIAAAGRSVARFFGFVGYVISAAVYLLLAAILTSLFFVYFSLRFESLAEVKRWIPQSRRERVWRCVRDVDAAFSGYIRGQIIVAMFTTLGFCIGFYLADVPYWFTISLIGGVLSLIPYGQMSGWILAVAAKLVETTTAGAGFDWISVLAAPTLVYAVTQSMETWVVTPQVQSETSRLHPLVIIVVLLVGASLGGVLGVMLAIPVAASIRSIYQHEFQEHLTAWIQRH